MKNPIILLAALTMTATIAACSNDPASAVAPTAAGSRGGSDSSATASTGGSSGTAAGNVEVRIALTPPTGAPFATAKGKAKFEVEGSEQELEIEVEHIPAGTGVAFFLGGTQLGTATANAMGEAELELENEHGATVPTSVSGQVVEVRTTTGAVIVRGTF